MSNHFFRITSNGGYFGRWFWNNSGALSESTDFMWGGVSFMPDGQNLKWGADSSVWAGTIWVIRVLTR